MMPYIKNIPHEEVLALAAQVTVQPGQVVSKTLAQNNHAVYAPEDFKMLLTVVFPTEA